MSVSITIAKPKDAAHVVAIGMQSFHDAFVHLFEKKEDLTNYLTYTYEVKKIQRSIQKENNIYFVAWVDGIPVGFAKVKKFSLNPGIPDYSQMELQKIYVLFEHHGTGAGAELMNAILSLALDLKPDVLWLDVHISNERAIRFYKKNGFNICGKHSFIIGSQTFEYHVMGIPVTSLKNINKPSYGHNV